MKKWLSFIVVLLLASSVFPMSWVNAESTASAPDERRLMVSFYEETSDHKRQSLVHSRGDRVIAEMEPLDTLVVEISEGDLLSEAMEYYRNQPEVEYVETDQPGSLDLIPNDPFFSTYQWGPQKINAPQAWDVTMGSSDVTIAIVDSGVEADHPDLGGRVVKGYDFVENDWEPQDEYGHGTHVAGIAAASTNNGIGIAGIAPHSKILAIRVFNNESDPGYSSFFAQGIVHAVDSGADVINCSFGINQPSRTLEKAVRYAWKKGAVIVGTAGNEPTSKPRYPAAYKPAISVANTDPNDEKAADSNYGNWVDIAAPGTDILSTIFGGQYYPVSGTSMSAPHVAGVAALLASQGYNNKEIRHIILETADPIPGTGTYWSAGRLNAEQAVRYKENQARMQVEIP